MQTWPPPGASARSGNGPGALLSLLLHGLLLLLALLYLAHRPSVSDTQLRDLPVLVRVRLLKSGMIDDVTIVDQQRFQTDKVFRNMALSARDAALLASPIQIPGTRFEKTQVLTISLDPKAVLR